MILKIDRDGIVQKAENAGMTVMEYAPDSSLAAKYRELAALIVEER